jgi:hypothetical protein
MKDQKNCSKCLPSFAMQASARRVQECLRFDEFPERRFEFAAKLQTEKLPGDLQNVVAGFQFREELLFLQLKCDLLFSGQNRAYSFRNA